MLTASRPGMPWMMKVVFPSIRMDMLVGVSGEGGGRPQPEGWGIRGVRCRALQDAVPLPHDEGCSGHQGPAFSTARRAASDIETVRSQYSTPYLARILKPSPSQEPGMRKI